MIDGYGILVYPVGEGYLPPQEFNQTPIYIKKEEVDTIPIQDLIRGKIECIESNETH
jgi:hypothetical protein